MGKDAQGNYNGIITVGLQVVGLPLYKNTEGRLGGVGKMLR
jgi:hypothetical protein